MKALKILKLILLFIPFLICKVFYKFMTAILVRIEDRNANPVHAICRCPKCGYFKTSMNFKPYTSCPICRTYLTKYNRKHGVNL